MTESKLGMAFFYPGSEERLPMPRDLLRIPPPNSVNHLQKDIRVEVHTRRETMGQDKARNRHGNEGRSPPNA